LQGKQSRNCILKTKSTCVLLDSNELKIVYDYLANIDLESLTLQWYEQAEMKGSTHEGFVQLALLIMVQI